MKALLDFNLTAKKPPLPCVVETSSPRMYCIYWPVMIQLKEGVHFSHTKLLCILLQKKQLTGVIETSGQMAYS